MKFFGIEPPKISLANSKPLPRVSGSILIQQSPNCPCPPVCFLWRPWTSALPRAAAGQHELARLRVAVEAQALVFLKDAVHGIAHAVFVVARLGFDGEE